MQSPISSTSRIRFRQIWTVSAVLIALLVPALFLPACEGGDALLPPDAPQTSPGVAAPEATPVTFSGTPVAAAANRETGAGTIDVVTSTVVLADIVRNVAGDRAVVHNLVSSGADVHTHQPTPGDSAAVAGADLIVSNGAGLLPAIDELIANSASADVIHVVASAGLESSSMTKLPFPAHAAEPEIHGRLLIGDGETGSLSIIHLGDGQVQESAFDVRARIGRIWTTASGRYAGVVPTDASDTHFFEVGIYRETQSDRVHLVRTDPRPVTIEEILDGGTGDARRSCTSSPFNGRAICEGFTFSHFGQRALAFPWGGAPPVDAGGYPDLPDRPSNREVFDRDLRDEEGNLLRRVEGCLSAQSAVGDGSYTVTPCVGGADVLRQIPGDEGGAFIPAPEGSPHDFRLISIQGFVDFDHFFGLSSDYGIYVVNPVSGTMEALIPGGQEPRPVQAVIDYDGVFLLVIMSDGEIRAYNAHTTDIFSAARDIFNGEINPDDWTRPHLATAPGRIYITDPSAGEVLELDVHDLEVLRRWGVAGKPTKIAFAGPLFTGVNKSDRPNDQVGGDHDDDHSNDDDDHDHESGDPHFWQDPHFAVHYVSQVANGLVAVDPDNAQAYLDNAAQYISRLEELDAYITEKVATIPHERRVIVTFHDAFGYFVTRYDFEVMAFVTNHGGDVSPDDIVAVLELVRDRHLPAVFAEPQFPDDALNQVARDAGIRVGRLRSLPDEQYPTYFDMMRANVDTLADLLR